MLNVVFTEAKQLGMTCDLIVGSGWPFGAENTAEEERSQIVAGDRDGHGLGDDAPAHQPVAVLAVEFAAPGKAA